MPDTHKIDGWEAVWLDPWLHLRHPNGADGVVQLRAVGTSQNITKAQFESSIRTHGVKRACEVFWKLRAVDA